MFRLGKLFFHYLKSNPKYVVSYFVYLIKKFFAQKQIHVTSFWFKIILDLKRGVDTEIHFNRFESNLADFYFSNLKKDSIFIDIGCNIGFFSLLAGKKN